MTYKPRRPMPLWLSDIISGFRIGTVAGIVVVLMILAAVWIITYNGLGL